MTGGIRCDAVFFVGGLRLLFPRAVISLSKYMQVAPK